MNIKMKIHNFLLLGALVCVYACYCDATGFAHPFSKPAKLVDEQGGAHMYESEAQLSELAKLVCKTKKDSKLISRISTVVKLADFFENNSSLHDDQLVACKEKYGASIRSLRNVITLRNDNICSVEKITAIEEFHKRFISSLSDDLQSRQPGEGEVPRMLLNFFAHYAAQISRMCKQSIVPLLEKDVRPLFPSEEDYSIGTGTDFTGKVTQTMGNLFSAVHHYEDVLLVWGLVDRQVQKRAGKSLIVDSVDEVTGEPVKLLMVANNIRPLVMAQQKCRQKFRPIYSQILMPVVRLADIGYSYSDSQLKKDEQLLLNDNKLAELWYRLTQFCETLLPVQFLQNSKLDDRATIMITLSEKSKYLEETAEVMKTLPEPEPLKYEPMQGLNRLPADEDKLRTIQSLDGGEPTVIKVKTSASARSRNIRRFIARSIRGIKAVYTGNLKFSRKAAQSMGIGGSYKDDGQVNGEFVVADIKGLLSKPNVEHELMRIENGEDEHGEDGIRSLKKRSDAGADLAAFVFFLLIVALVAVCIWLIVIFFMAVFGG